jgi:hypothetical protein
LTHPLPFEIARSYFQRGWMPLPVPFRSKNPGFRGWQNFTVTEDYLTHHFNGQPQNIGVLLGEASGNLVDIDLDCAEAISLAQHFLPVTSAIFGRQTRQRSHWLYVAPVSKKVTFTDPVTGKRLIEILTNGQQAIFPGSTHKDTGEFVRWYEEGEPSCISEYDLVRAAKRLAAATILAQYWPQVGSRQDAALALAGGLLRAGWTEDEATNFIEAVCREAQDEETLARTRTVVYTDAKIQRGTYVTGWPTLAKFIDKRTVDCVCKWLEIQKNLRDAEYALDIGGTTTTHGYTVEDGCLARLKQIQSGQILVRLCNFDAKIVTDIVEDDGAAERRVYEVQGKLVSQNTYSKVSVSADEFGAMKWVDKLLGAAATVFAGQSEHMRCAVKLLSDEIARSTIYTHTGWREFPDGWRYLHSDGAIGEDGNSASIAVRLPDSLAAFVLLDPPHGVDLVSAVRHYLNGISVAAPSVTFPLFGAAWAAILGGCDFSLHLAGDTGAGKSELAALVQAHFGGGFDREHLPGAWVSTGNSLERLAHAAKDAVLVVDDFAPMGTATDTARAHREADRLLRAQGNHAGRLRLRSDTTFNAARAPRGLIVSTGEDIPRGASLRARMWVLEVEKERGGHAGAVNFAALTECQQHARAGVYASVTAAFVQWLSPNYKRVTEQALEELADLRNEFAAKSEGHKRHATTAAKLMRAWNLFLDFATSQGAISDDEREQFTRQAWEALVDVARRQEEHQASQDPATRFVELITAALSTGAAHIAWDADGGRPKTDLMAFGWRGNDAQGKRIGWTDGINVYLEPDTAYAVANELGGKTGASIAVTPTTLWKRLNERGLLIREETRESLKKRHNIEGRRMSVIAFRATHILGGRDVSQKPDQPDQLDSPNSETWAAVRFNE